MAIVNSGRSLLNFYGENGFDPIFSGNVQFVFGTGRLNDTETALISPAFTAGGVVRSTRKAITNDLKTITDVVTLSADITNQIGINEISEIGLKVDEQYVVVKSVELPNDKEVKITKSATGSTFVEWTFIRSRNNQTYLVFSNEEYDVFIHPQLNNSNKNGAILSFLGNVVIKKDELASYEVHSARSNSKITQNEDGSLLMEVEISLLPANSITKAYPYNSIKELRIGTVDIGSTGFCSVVWKKTKTKENVESFRFSIALPILVSTI